MGLLPIDMRNSINMTSLRDLKKKQLVLFVE